MWNAQHEDWSELFPMCCKNCEPAYQQIIRLEQQLRNEELKTDVIQRHILGILRQYPAEFQKEQATIPSKLFEKLWDAAQLRWHDAETFIDFLGESLAEGWVLIEARRLFDDRSRQPNSTAKEKLISLYDAIKKVYEFHDWKFNTNYTPEQVIEQIKNS